MIVRGVEGGIFPSLKQAGKAFGLHGKNEETEWDFHADDLGFAHDSRAVPLPDSDMPAEQMAQAAAETGLAALGGQAGPAKDSLQYAAGMILAHLDGSRDIRHHYPTACEAIDSGRGAGTFRSGAVAMDESAQLSLQSGIAAFASKQFSRALQLLTPLAEAGEPEAQYRCAIMCQNGLGCVVDAGRAFAWMTAAAEAGLALAQHGLGFMYMEGECVEQNGEKAVYWYEKAAEQGLAGSLTTLAMMYEEGKLVPQDTERARALYKKAGF